MCVGEVAASDTRNAFSHLREQENSRLREKLCHHPELHHDICTLVRDLNLEVRSWVRADVVRVVRADTFHLTERCVMLRRERSGNASSRSKVSCGTLCRACLPMNLKRSFSCRPVPQEASRQHSSYLLSQLDI